MVVGVDVDELSSPAVAVLVVAKLKTGVVDVSVTDDTVAVAVGASNNAGSRDVVTRVAEGSGGRTVRGFASVWESVVEELGADVAASAKVNLAPLIESRGEAALAAGDICGAAALNGKADVVV
ncbi:hypothetical protein QO004_001667 [Rhizobium mesoamericanum]|uniref:hypothetical protein n=1 Tax=Rhizobium mesoamericanum TaxID=1079800 RepID=UPI0027876CCC|nr:hypothetical protein [Rhizobium mesoamericanum]MDQ0559885.1 hypothetical protein [Rhizobium mesoamericanum]